MKIAPICLLTACKRRKFKLFGDSSQIRAIDNGITCCYWSASLSNRLRALKAHSSLLKCCAKKLPKIYVLDTRKTSWFLSLGISSIIVSLKLIFIFPFNLYSISIFFFNSRGRVPLAGNSLRAEKSHWQFQKSDIGRAEKSHKGQNVTLKCYNFAYMVSVFRSFPNMVSVYPCLPYMVMLPKIWI